MNNIFYVYVYIHPEKGTPIYVGKGKGDRFKDHLTRSSNRIFEAKLKVWRSEGNLPSVEIYKDNLKEDEALSLEAELIQQYGTVIDGGILYNISKGGRGHTRYTFDDSFYERLGEVNDEILANEYGCTSSNVSVIRRGLGIEPCKDKPNYVPPPPMGGWNKKELPDWIIKDLGREPDYKLAEKIGVCKAVIARRRKELNIEPYGKGGGRNGRFTKGSFARMDKTIRQFYNEVTGEGFIGTKLFFADHLNIDSSRVNELIKSRIKRLCKEWVYVGDIK